jgi:hypothetical protein
MQAAAPPHGPSAVSTSWCAPWTLVGAESSGSMRPHRPHRPRSHALRWLSSCDAYASRRFS